MHRLGYYCLLAVLTAIAHAVDPLVNLGYTRYRGKALDNGISQWLGIRFAAPPLGKLRFAAPVDPPSNCSIQEANTHGPICLGTGQTLPAKQSNEDCLFLDVYAPSHATCNSKLPVMVWIQGGGFNTNSNANYDGSGLITAGDKEMIVVTFNYRVGPYGFLAGKEISAGGSHNNGLKDQRKVFEWVQKHITKFGGNPDHVVIVGASAGGGSVALHLTAYGGQDQGLFHASAATAQSFPSVNTIEQSQYQYDRLVNRTGCSTSTDTLSCLRSLNATFLQSQNINTASPGAPGAPLYMYGPVIDSDLLRKPTLSAFANGNFIKLPAIYGDATNEGTIFATPSLSTISASDDFYKNQFPDLNATQLATLNALYPRAEQFPGTGEYWRATANGYGEMRYICPGIFVSDRYRSVLGVEYSKVWNYHWDVRDPADEASGVGVKHTVEINAIFGAENVNGAAPKSYAAGQSNADVAGRIQRLWAGFVRALDPNAFTGEELWKSWGLGRKRLLFTTNSTVMEAVDAGQEARCATLLAWREQLRQ